MVGAFLLPLVAGFTGAAALLPREVARAAAENAWIWIHVTLVMLGSAAFAFIFGVGLMYLVQERQLKAKAPSPLAFRLPPLEVLDAAAYEALWLGFPLLTLGIALGSLQAQQLWGVWWVWGTKETWSLLTWLIYGLLLLARLNKGMRGRKAAILSIVGFGAVLVTFLGVSLFGPRYEPWVIMVLPPGGFFTLAFVLLAVAWWKRRQAARARVRAAGATVLEEQAA